MDALTPVVLLEAFYRRGTAGVPCPADGESVDWWWDHLAKQAPVIPSYLQHDPLGYS